MPTEAFNLDEARKLADNLYALYQYSPHSYAKVLKSAAMARIN